MDVLFIDAPPRTEVQRLFKLYQQGHDLLKGSDAGSSVQGNFNVPYWAANMLPIVSAAGLTAGFICPKREALKIPRARLYLISSFTGNYVCACEIAQLIRREDPVACIVLGGHHATSARAECLLDAPFDAVVVGDGEEALRGLLESVFRGTGKLDAIPGVCCRAGELLVTNTLSSYDNVFNEHLPDFGFLDAPQKNSVLEVRLVTSKGCPGRCAYCIDASTPLKEKSQTRVMSELTNLRSHFPSLSFVHLDDCQFVKSRGFKETCTTFAEFGVPWSCQTRVDYLRRDRLELLLESGCRVIRVGGESGNDEMLQRVAKHTTVEKILRGCALAKEVGLKIKTFWMVGLPDESEISARNTIDTALRMLREGLTDVAELYICVPYPGTDLYHFPERYNLRIERELYYRNFLEYGLSCTHTRHLSNHDICRIWEEGIEEITSALSACS